MTDLEPGGKFEFYYREYLEVTLLGKERGRAAKFSYYMSSL